MTSHNDNRLATAIDSFNGKYFIQISQSQCFEYKPTYFGGSLLLDFPEPVGEELSLIVTIYNKSTDLPVYTLAFNKLYEGYEDLHTPTIDQAVESIILDWYEQGIFTYVPFGHDNES